MVRTRIAPLPGIAVAFALLAAACSGASPEIDTAGDPDETTTTSSEPAAESSEITVDGSESSDAMGEDEATPTTVLPEVDEPVATERSLPTVDVPDGVPVEAGQELAAAAVTGNEARFTAPYVYVSAEQDCAGCAEFVDLYYVPRDDNPLRHRLDMAWVDGVQQPLDVVDPLLQIADPLFVAEELLDAIAAGDDVTYRVDPVSGLVTSWTIDGSTASMRCLQVDLAPESLRDYLCAGSLIG